MLDDSLHSQLLHIHNRGMSEGMNLRPIDGGSYFSNNWVDNRTLFSGHTHIENEHQLRV